MTQEGEEGLRSRRLPTEDVVEELEEDVIGAEVVSQRKRGRPPKKRRGRPPKRVNMAFQPVDDVSFFIPDSVFLVFLLSASFRSLSQTFPLLSDQAFRVFSLGSRGGETPFKGG
jgi:hypothetical protein